MKIEEVIVKAENQQFLIDFMVVDMKVSKNLSIHPILMGDCSQLPKKVITNLDKRIVELKWDQRKLNF